MNQSVLREVAEPAFREELRAWMRDVLPQGWLEAVRDGDEERLTVLRPQVDFLSWPALIGRSPYAAPLWPREHGGLSGRPWMLRIVREELSSWRLPLFGLNLLGIGMAGPTLIEHGSHEQKAHHLPRILTGEETWCQLFSEPGAGSDLASLGTRAVRDGNSWVVNGQKVWTTIAQFADYGMLLARTNPEVPKHSGLTYFICDMKAPGVDVRPLRQMTGGAEFNEVYLTDVRISDHCRVGSVDDGWRVARTTLMNERVTLGGISLDAAALGGSARRDPWGSYLEHLPDRRNPSERQRLVRIYIEQRVKDMTAHRVEAARAAGRQPGPEGAIAKVFNAEHVRRRAELPLDLAGGTAMAWTPGDRRAEGRVQAFLRSRAATIEGGTSEVLRNQIAERILGLPRESDADHGLPWKATWRST